MAEMKAIQIQQPGGPEALVYTDVPMPEPQPNELRVKVVAAGVNFIDTYHRSGSYKMPLPFTPGVEMAGVVDAVGAGVLDFAVGDHVACGFHPGAYAEYSCIPAAKAIRVPTELDLKLAAAVLLQGMTAHYLTYSTFPLGAAHTALVHAAAGATGQLVVQLAKRQGARVIGTVSTSEKGAIALGLGADEIIIYTQHDFVEQVRLLTNGEGVDVVYDSVGQTTFDGGLDCLKPRGMMVLYGQSSGAVPPIDLQVLNAKGSLFVTRPTLGNYIATANELATRSSDVLNALLDGTLKVRVDHEYPLAEAAAAHTALESRTTAGKLLLLP